MMIEESKDYDIQVFLAFMNVVHSDDLKKIPGYCESQTAVGESGSRRFRPRGRPAGGNQ